MPMEDDHRGRSLLVAAGGGGDALASLLMSRRLAADHSPLVVSYSWDRRILDPLPGPRFAADFEEARQLTPRNLEITAKARLRSGGLSTLGLLAKTTTARFVLLDPRGGATSMRQQLVQLIETLSFESAVLVDVGGDVLATGVEAELRSPVADALSLAALTDFPVPVDIAVAGLGSWCPMGVGRPLGEDGWGGGWPVGCGSWSGRADRLPWSWSYAGATAQPLDR
jgi:hypothetical protein